jgi:hypothetical protein
MWTGSDVNSHFEEGFIDLQGGERGDLLSVIVEATQLTFRETLSGGSWEWHKDPVPRFVITLTGVLEFETRGGGRFTINPGDIPLAEDDSGTGHRWRLVGTDPWQRAYVVYQAEAEMPFKVKIA